jgi:hypothetical protein
MPAGRPPKFESVDVLEQAFRDWKETFEDEKNTDIPDVEGFCDFVGAYRDILNNYEKDPEFSNTIKIIKNWIYYKKKQLAMQGKMNAAIFIFDAKNNAGYVDRSELEAKVQTMTPIMGGLSKAPLDDVHTNDDD